MADGSPVITPSEFVLPGTTWLAVQEALAERRKVDQSDTPLDASGFLVDGELTSAATHLLQGFLEPSGAVRVRILTANDTREATAWVHWDRSATWDLTVGDTTILRRNEPGMVPLNLAALLDLGPRPAQLLSHCESVEVEVIDQLLQADSAQMASDRLAVEIRPLWPEIAAELTDGNWKVWVVEAFAVGVEPTRSRGAACLIDTSAGLLGVDLGHELATLTPVTTAKVWELLTTMIAPAT